MNLKQLVDAGSVICTADITSKKRVLELLAQLLANNSDKDSESIASRPLGIFQQLTEREKLGSTSLGHGVALPHARTNLCTQAVGAFIKMEDGIDFDSPDGEPTDLLFALLVPEHYTDEHLEILASLASLFNNPDFCHNLRTAKTSIELHNRLTDWNITKQAS